jgi:chromosome segregation ATPase
MLEDEKARNLALEDSYAQLLRQVQQLQNTHLVDLRNSETRFHSASAALQKALVSKSEELVTLSNRLTSSDARYERDSREWAKERVSMLAQLETLSVASAEQINKINDRENRLTEVNKYRKELAERIAIREQDLIKYGKALRDREGEFAKEKEMRIKMENRVNNFEQHQVERDMQFRELQNQLHRKTLEAEELAGLKIVYNEAKRDLDDQTRKEKHYNTEIDQMAARERKLFQKVEELSTHERKFAQEMTKSIEKQAALTKELEVRHLREERLNKEIEGAQSKIYEQNSEVAKFEKQARQLQMDTNRLLSEFNSLQSSEKELQQANSSLIRELNSIKSKEEDFSKEKDSVHTKVSALNKDIHVKNRELEELRNENRQLNQRLDLEVAQQAEMRHQNKEKYGMVSSKIAELQETLVETQNQLAELRVNEKNMRSALRQKDEALKSYTQILQDAEHKVQELLASASKEALEFESFKHKKRDEIIAIQDKYSSAKQSMDNEVSQLKYQYQQKQAQYNGLVEELAEVKSELTEYVSAKMALESKLSDLSSIENSQQRQISSLTSNLNQKTLEVSRLTTKYNNLLDQTRRFEEELALYRENTSTTRDADINRLQSNMEEISKRLKSQVDVLLEKDSTNDSSPSMSHSSASLVVAPLPIIRPRFSIANSAASNSSPRSAANRLMDENNAEFDHLFKQLGNGKSAM